MFCAIQLYSHQQNLIIWSFPSPHFGLCITLIEAIFGSKSFLSHLCIWVLCLYIFCCQSLLRTVDCDIFTRALWNLLVISLTVVLGFFFSALTTFLSLNRSSFKYQETIIILTSWSRTHMSSVGLRPCGNSNYSDDCNQCYSRHLSMILMLCWSEDVHSSINPVSVPITCIYIQEGAASLYVHVCYWDV